MGPYEVVEEIGHGGMATVYVAEDLRHNRRVALGARRYATAESLLAHLTRGDRSQRVTLAYIYVLTGRAQHARALLKAGQGSELDQPTYHAGVYAVIGDTAAAFAELDRAILTHDPLVGDMKVDPRLDPLRGHPRFIAIMQRLAFPP